MRGTPRGDWRRLERRVLICRTTRVSQYPSARCVDETGRQSAIQPAAGDAEQRLDRAAVHIDRALRSVERRVHDHIGFLGRAHICRGLHELADDRAGAAQGNMFGLLRIADERGHMVTGTKRCFEDRRADVACRAREEDAHDRAVYSTPDTAVFSGQLTCVGGRRPTAGRKYRPFSWEERR